MQRGARASVTATAALAAGSVIAVTPTMSYLPGVQVRPFQLASDDIVLADPLAELQAEELSANTALVLQETTVNQSIVAQEEALALSNASAVPTGPDDLTGVADRLFDVNNLLLSTSENIFNGTLGADNFDPAAINSSLLLGPTAVATGPGVGTAPDFAGGGGGVTGDAPFLSGQIGGIEGVTGNTLAAYSLATTDVISLDIVALGNAFLTFNNTLIGDELAFNGNLLNEEVLAEVAAFGSNDALNGSIDRLINIENLPLAIDETALNSLLGADSDTGLPPAFDGFTLPEALTQSLLTGTGSSPTDIPNVFDTGDLGGVEGIFDQNAALLADLAGLNSAEITSALDPGAFNTAEFTAAVSSLFDVSDFSNLAPDFSAISTDLSAVLMSLF